MSGESNYRELDPNVFYGQETSTSRWINLGLWVGGCKMKYSVACESMAAAVGSFAKLNPGDKVIDVGCGFGDSLMLWRNRYGCKQVVGVNITKGECDVARERIKKQDNMENIQVLNEDAMVYLNKVDKLDGKVVSVDAMVNVNNRRTFLNRLGDVLTLEQGCKTFTAIDTFGTTNFLAENGSIWESFISSPFKFSFVYIVSVCGGIPLDNLMYKIESLESNLSLREDVSVRILDQSDVTDLVFVPFSQHMLSKSWNAFCSGNMLSSVTLLSAALFMRLLGVSSLFRVYLYSVEYFEC
mmetsp:Transcript_20797/g.34431  ORF Transcript_20797/g.34431 Transcript_20797/m.34431 type:complete len:297 (+) Transcript_20797:198-1088(+)